MIFFPVKMRIVGDELTRQERLHHRMPPVLNKKFKPLGNNRKDIPALTRNNDERQERIKTGDLPGIRVNERNIF